jgi:Zinc knuckle
VVEDLVVNKDTATAAKLAMLVVASVHKLSLLGNLHLGHMAKDCSQGQKCYNCGRLGHVSRDCDQAAQAKVCYRCVLKISFTDDRCQQPGHISRDCTNDPVETS